MRIKNFNDLEKSIKQEEKMTLVIAAAEETEILKAASKAKEQINFILTGNKVKIKKRLFENNIDLEAEIIESEDSVSACEKAVALIHERRADFIMKGLVETSIFLKAIIDKKKGLVSKQLLSSVMLMKIATYPKFLILSDGGMIIAPDLEAKKEIIKNAVSLGRLLEMNPIKVACLAAKEKVNPKMQATVDGLALKNLGEEGYFGEDVIVDGPMAMDLIVSKKSAEIKGYVSAVSGDADIILVPEVETGNAIMKVMTHLGEAELAGVVMGAQVPIVLTSRSDSQKNKLNSMRLGAYIIAQQKQ